MRFGDSWFPEEAWIDFIEVVQWWVDGLEERGHRTLQFMDGPFEIELDDVEGDPDLADVSFLVRRADGSADAELTGIVSKSQFRGALADACRKIAALLREAGYEQEAERYERTASRHTN